MKKAPYLLLWKWDKLNKSSIVFPQSCIVPWKYVVESIWFYQKSLPTNVGHSTPSKTLFVIVGFLYLWVLKSGSQ